MELGWFAIRLAEDCSPSPYKQSLGHGHASNIIASRRPYFQPGWSRVFVLFYFGLTCAELHLGPLIYCYWAIFPVLSWDFLRENVPASIVEDCNLSLCRLKSHIMSFMLYFIEAIMTWSCLNSGNTDSIAQWEEHLRTDMLQIIIELTNISWNSKIVK